MVGALVGSPQAKGLFNRAIAQSGGWMGLTMGRMQASAVAEAAGAKAVDAMGVKSIAELRARPLDQLTGLPGGAGLLIDGYLIPEDLSITFRNGKQNAVDVLTGSNKDEANFGICPGAGLNGRGGGPSTTVEAFKASAQRKYADQAEAFLRSYPTRSDADAARAAHEACADEISWNMRQWAAAQAKLGKKAYTYFFTKTPTINGQPSPQGATHTADISYAFNNPKGQPNQTWNDADTMLGDTMSSYWVNFMTRGDPNGSGLPQWPPFKELGKSKVMMLGDPVKAEDAVPAAKLTLFDTAYARMLSTQGTN
jgi:para-nitrobenzyl esterase